tara:strand:+ start:36 stop:893 length:858 start_codon:yes stop_codon:yes gene_type:complete
MAKISYSQLSLYTNCPHQWKLRYIDKITESESNIHLVFGTAMHETLQHYLDVMYKHTVKKADEINLPKFLQKALITEFKKAEETDGKPPCTKEQLTEFFEDGLQILDFFKKKRGEYFSKNGWELVGIEKPINVELKGKLRIIGFLDIVMYDKIGNRIKIIDIKTSTNGWNKWMKKDENKTAQLLLYKQFYSKQYGFPVENIDVEYFIVKRKLYENAMFPQKRVQKFSPASGTVSMNKVAKKLKAFMDDAFTEDGEHNIKEYEKTPSKKACRWCEFKNTEYCTEGV